MSNYLDLFSVPPSLDDLDEVLMSRITGNERHARDTLTQVASRRDANKNATRVEIRRLVQRIEEGHQNELMFANANIGGAIIRGLFSTKHAKEFWDLNWEPAPEAVMPHGIFYDVIGVENQESFSWYCSEEKIAVFLNSSYYGQAKSWALGMVMDILKDRGIHSIHGSCVEVDGKGVIMIAPTGTGKSTLCYGLLSEPNSEWHSDDWVYVQFQNDRNGRPKQAVGRFSEVYFYMRTDTARDFPELIPIFEESLLENVPVNDEGEFLWDAFENSRVMVDPARIVGEERISRYTSLDKVIFLRRDPESAEVEYLSPEKAVEILEEGKMHFLAGTGKRGRGVQPYLNPYILVNDLHDRDDERAQLNIELQNLFFARLFEITGGAIYLNTANRTPKESLQTLKSLIRESAPSSNFDARAYETPQTRDILISALAY